ncbi:hypothetical protein FACS189434_00980 [Bacteroidia bacterium]|nr:hypothetical protein FACS189434_00980 [Bacteroidia bacterium]
MTKKELNKAVKQSILSGKTKQETFDNFKGESPLSYEETARIVDSYPTLESRDEYKSINMILIILLSITVLSKLLLGVLFMENNGMRFFPVLFIFPILNIIFLYCVATYNNVYKWIAILTGIGFLRSLSDIIGNPVDVFMIIDIALTIGLIIVSVYLHIKLFPGYKMVVNREIDNEGKIKITRVVKFEE